MNPILLVLGGAVALLLSYPPFPLPVLSFFAITPAVLLVRGAALEANPRRAFRLGWWYGLAANALVLYWMIVALWHFTPFSALGYLATIVVLGAVTGGLFWFLVRARMAMPRVPLWVTLPLAWTTLEWLIGHLPDVAFPWLGLGTSLADAPILVQWADLAGARGVTLWVAWCNVAIIEAALGMREAGSGRRTALLRFLVPVLASIALALGYGAWRMKTLPLRQVGVVALVQPNEGFREKWAPGHEDAVVAKLLSMSRSALARARPQLVLWPEVAVPGYLFQNPGWDTAIAGLARASHTPILTGVLHADLNAPRPVPYYNAAFLYDSTGDRRAQPVYEKRYLVPIVERVPFVPVAWLRRVPGLGRWSGGFSRGRDLPVYETAIGKFGVIICYESAFEDLPRRYRARGADFLVNITNDAWFALTAAPYQHASHLVLRAIETRMGVARAANSGVSEFLDPLGRAYDATLLEQETVVISDPPFRTSDVVPPYVKLGDWVGLLAVLATLGLSSVLTTQWWQRRARPSA